MSKHSLLTKELFEQGYSCAQSVVLAFCDETGLQEDFALMLSSSFGAGVGRMREICGAVSGMAMIIGIMYGYTSPTDDEAKAEHYQLIQTLTAKFKEKNNSIICRDLLGDIIEEKETFVPEKRSSAYYEKRPCGDLVMCAAQILDEYIESRRENS